MSNPENKPLTWEELRTMEGKPIWVEIGFYFPCWLLISFFETNQMIATDAAGKIIRLNKDEILEKWRAYRKEKTKPNEE